MTTEASELGYQFGVFQLICLCRRKRKYRGTPGSRDLDVEITDIHRIRSTRAHAHGTAKAQDPAKNNGKDATNKPQKHPKDATKIPDKHPTKETTNKPTKHPTNNPDKHPTKDTTNKPEKYPTKDTIGETKKATKDDNNDACADKTENEIKDEKENFTGREEKREVMKQRQQNPGNVIQKLMQPLTAAAVANTLRVSDFVCDPVGVITCLPNMLEFYPHENMLRCCIFLSYESVSGRNCRTITSHLPCHNESGASIRGIQTQKSHDPLEGEACDKLENISC